MAHNTQGTITIADYDEEITTVTVHLDNLDTTGSNYPAVTQDLDEIKDSILTVIRGNVRKTTLSKEFTENGAVVVDPMAQRETKWLVTMRDTTEFLDVLNAVGNPGYLQLFNFSIGTADLTHLNVNADTMDVSDAPGDAFLASMEANVRSPWNDNPEAAVVQTQVVVAIVAVGRNT